MTINATASDSDVDNNLDPSTATVERYPSNGQVVSKGDGTFIIRRMRTSTALTASCTKSTMRMGCAIPLR